MEDVKKDCCRIEKDAGREEKSFRHKRENGITQQKNSRLKHTDVQRSSLKSKRNERRRPINRSGDNAGPRHWSRYSADVMKMLSMQNHREEEKIKL